MIGRMISSSEGIKSQSLKFSKSKRLTKSSPPCQQLSYPPPPPLVSLCQHLPDAPFVSQSFEKKAFWHDKLDNIQYSFGRVPVVGLTVGLNIYG